MSTMSQLGEFIATIQNNQDARTAELEERLSTLEGNEEGKGECVCGTYDEFLAAYEERISALEGGGGSTEPIPASQALEEYGFLFGHHRDTEINKGVIAFMTAVGYRISTGDYSRGLNPPDQSVSVNYLLVANDGDIRKVYTPDLQEIEIIADSALPYFTSFTGSFPLAVGNLETKEVHCYQVDCENNVVSPCTDEAFIAQWGNSDALDL